MTRRKGIPPNRRWYLTITCFASGQVITRTKDSESVGSESGIVLRVGSACATDEMDRKLQIRNNMECDEELTATSASSVIAREQRVASWAGHYSVGSQTCKSLVNGLPSLVFVTLLCHLSAAASGQQGLASFLFCFHESLCPPQRSGWAKVAPTTPSSHQARQVAISFL